METLTKENFWNELQEKYPAGIKIFCDWIDEYKKQVDWEKLFNGNLSSGLAPVPKFHDLPIAMQVGIWMQFENDMAKGIHFPFYFLGAKKHITEFVKDLHEEATD